MSSTRAAPRSLRELLVLLAIVLLGMGLRFWWLDELSLVADESYYWLWSQHLALCYLDHPGGVAWLIWLSTALGGGSEFGVRWLNALLGTGNILLVYGLARRVLAGAFDETTERAGLGHLAGVAAAAILAVAPPYVLISRFVYPDTLPIFLLLASFNLCWPILAGHLGQRWPVARWFAIGVTWLLLVNTKISLYPALLGLALGALLWRRDLMRERDLWFAVGLGLLGLAPLLAWNATHDWTGIRWTWQHFTQGTVQSPGPLQVVRHIIAYFTPPALLLIAAGYLTAGWPRVRSRARWLVLPSLFAVLPVLLSPANSPRNLLVGLALVVPLAGAWWSAGAPGTLSSSVSTGRFVPWTQRLRPLVLVTGILVASLYATGTVQALFAETRMPQSSVAEAMRVDAAGWRELGVRLRAEPGLLFTVDYSSASQLTYYATRPVFTAWPQYLIWGLPDFDAADVLSLSYVAPGRVDAAMRQAFRQVDGPQVETLREYGSGKELRRWHGEGLRVDKATFVRLLDLFALSEAGL